MQNLGWTLGIQETGCPWEQRSAPSSQPARRDSCHCFSFFKGEGGVGGRERDNFGSLNNPLYPTAINVLRSVEVRTARETVQQHINKRKVTLWIAIIGTVLDVALCSSSCLVINGVSIAVAKSAGVSSSKSEFCSLDKTNQAWIKLSYDQSIHQTARDSAGCTFHAVSHTILYS